MGGGGARSTQADADVAKTHLRRRSLGEASRLARRPCKGNASRPSDLTIGPLGVAPITPPTATQRFARACVKPCAKRGATLATLLSPQGIEKSVRTCPVRKVVACVGVAVGRQPSTQSWTCPGHVHVTTNMHNIYTHVCACTHSSPFPPDPAASVTRLSSASTLTHVTHTPFPRRTVAHP